MLMVHKYCQWIEDKKHVSLPLSTVLAGMTFGDADSTPIAGLYQHTKSPILKRANNIHKSSSFQHL